MQQGASRDQLEAQVTQRAASDPQFRQDLLGNPKHALQQSLGVQIPDTINVQVIEETPTSFALVLPPATQQAGQELSRSDLEAVAGGWSDAGQCAGTAQATCDIFKC